MNNNIISLLQEITLINNERLNLAKRENEIRQKLSLIKKLIENENQHLVGKKAIGTNEHGLKVEVICTAVKCNEDFKPIPLFTRNRKNYHVEIFDWID